jgi:hypothetical protein
MQHDVFNLMLFMRRLPESSSSQEKLEIISRITGLTKYMWPSSSKVEECTKLVCKI